MGWLLRNRIAAVAHFNDHTTPKLSPKASPRGPLPPPISNCGEWQWICLCMASNHEDRGEIEKGVNQFLELEPYPVSG
jgi:hypothetical protein